MGKEVNAPFSGRADSEVLVRLRYGVFSPVLWSPRGVAPSRAYRLPPVIVIHCNYNRVCCRWGKT